MEDKGAIRGCIHETLEGGRGVGETKEHDSRFKETLVGNKGGFPGKGIGITNGVFIEVSVILAGVEVSILLFDNEEGESLGRVGRADFARSEIFVKEVFCGCSFIGREGIDFLNLRDKGFIKVYFVIIRLGWGYVVSGFFGEDRGEFSVFRGRVTFGLAFSAAIASAVVVVSLAMRGDPAGINQEPQHMIQ